MSKIDRNDMLELTRRMNPSRTCFMRIAGCYMSSEGEIDDTFNVNFLKLSANDKVRNLAIAKAIPFSRTNDQLKEYFFDPKAMGAGSFWQLLTGIHDCGLKNDLLMEVFYEQMGLHYYSEEDYGVYIFHGTYDIPVKDTVGERMDDSVEIYDFIICAVCPLKEEYEPGEPEFGFLFPAFRDRSADPSAIDIYHREPEEPQQGLVNLILTGREN